MKFSGTSDYVATGDLTVAVNASIALERPLLRHPGIRERSGARRATRVDRVVALHLDQKRDDFSVNVG